MNYPHFLFFIIKINVLKFANFIKDDYLCVNNQAMEYRLTEKMLPDNIIHPGEYIRDEISARGITQRQLAEKIGMQPSILNEIINGKRSVNIEFAMLLEAALGIDADIWIRLQNLYTKQKALMNPDFMSRLSKVTRITSVL